MLAAWEGVKVNNWPATRGCGGDFPQYYVAGTIIRRGEAERLYDQPYFRHFQQSMRDDPLGSIYPPTTGLLMAPLSRLSYGAALAAWWAIHAVCILATGVILYRRPWVHGARPLPRPWRINMLVALAALVPLWIAVGIGQLAPLLVLVLAGGLTLHKQGRRGWAGLLLSLLALKPQLVVGLLLWMLLRRDLRTLLGLAAGFALQAMAVAALLGPGAWLDYLHALPAISTLTRRCALFAADGGLAGGHGEQSAVGGRAGGMGSGGDENHLRGHGQRGRGHALPHGLGAAVVQQGGP